MVRAQAIMEVGGSPMYTMTEDYALGMELKKYGWHCRYVQEYLAIGEAPHEVRNMYQQRSRWTKVSQLPPCICATCYAAYVFMPAAAACEHIDILLSKLPHGAVLCML